MSANVLEFDPQTHVYTVAGRRLESVTQILEDVGISDYGSLPPSIREEALRRGRQVHEAIDLDTVNDLDESSVSPAYLPYVLAARAFRRESQFTVELHEHRSYHPVHMYAGTLDLKGTANLGNGRRRVLVDYKSGQAPGWVPYQLAAYAAFFPSPGAELRVCVELHADGTYEYFEFPAAEYRADMDVFLSALTVMRVKRLMSYEH